jgi:hypothetical protein
MKLIVHEAVTRIPARQAFLVARTSKGGSVLIRWLLQFLQRFFLFCIFVIGGARAFSWLFGYDDEMKIWAAQKPVACSDRIGTFGYHVCDVRLARRG